MMTHAKQRVGALLAVLLVGAPATALGQANCRNTGAFEPWLAAFKKEAAAQGISQATIAAASPYMVLDQRIINIDRGQRFFAQNFLEISDKMLAGGRLPNGAAQMKKHQALFAREEKEFGVPASVITAFWGLESDFGSGQGKDQAIKSLTTLAYDCRRSEMFRGHLFDALRLIERGDLRADAVPMLMDVMRVITAGLVFAASGDLELQAHSVESVKALLTGDLLGNGPNGPI